MNEVKAQNPLAEIANRNWSRRHRSESPVYLNDMAVLCEAVSGTGNDVRALREMIEVIGHAVTMAHHTDDHRRGEVVTADETLSTSLLDMGIVVPDAGRSADVREMIGFISGVALAAQTKARMLEEYLFALHCRLEKLGRWHGLDQPKAAATA